MTKETRIYNETDSLVNKWCGENWAAACKRIRLEHFLTPHTKISQNGLKA